MPGKPTMIRTTANRSSRSRTRRSGRPRSANRATSIHARSLRVEQLEDRALLSIFAATNLDDDSLPQMGDVSESGQLSTQAPLSIQEIYATDFEDFALGWLDSQNGWTTLTASTVQPTIATANPASGSKHLRITSDSGLDPGVHIGGYSPYGGSGPIGAYETSIDVSIDSPEGENYDDYYVLAYSVSQASFVATVMFYRTGDIYVTECRRSSESIRAGVLCVRGNGARDSDCGGETTGNGWFVGGDGGRRWARSWLGTRV